MLSPSVVIVWALELMENPISLVAFGLLNIPPIHWVNSVPYAVD